MPADHPPTPARASRNELSTGIGVLLLLVTVFHGPSLKNGFVYDDAWTIVTNPILRRPANVLTLLGQGPARDLVPDAGRPALLATEMLDHALWGLSPRGYHLQNILWHTAVVLLLFLGLASSAGGFLFPFTAAALFAVHPINVETVSVINYREDLLAAFFVLTTLLAVAQARRASGQGTKMAFRALGCLLAILGAFSKENATMVPFVLVALDVLAAPSRRPGKAVLRAFLPDYLLLASAVIAVFIWRTWAMGKPAVVSLSAQTVPFAEAGTTFFQSTSALLRGMGQLVLPVHFAPDYAGAPSALTAGVLSTVVLILAAAWVYRLRHDHPWLAFGVLGGILAYLPTLGLVPITNVRADRYFYLPSMPLLIAVAYLLTTGLSRTKWLGQGSTFDLPRPWLVVATIVALLGARSIRQGRIWRDDLTLWTFGTAAEPGSPRAWAALAQAQLGRGQTVDALASAERSLTLAEDGGTRQLLGIILMQQGALPSALQELQRAAELGVGNRAELLNNLGYCELRLRQPAKALSHLEESQRLARRYDRPWLNAATAYMDLGLPDKAIDTLRRLVARLPESTDGWKRLGIILEGRGDPAGALAAFREARTLSPKDSETAEAISRLTKIPGGR